MTGGHEVAGSSPVAPIVVTCLRVMDCVMAVLVGIDEAGFGPILGPLVVSSSTFLLPKSLVEKDLWQVLKRSVAERRRGMGGRILISDSKKAYSKSIGIKHLERTVLTFLKYLGKQPADMTELMEILCPESLGRLGGYPWHKNSQNRCFSADNGDIEIAVKAIRDDMETSGIEFAGFVSSCLDVGYYNKMVSRVKNKATVLFTAICQLIEEAFNRFGEKELHIIIDRQGGRQHYRGVLQKMFGELELKILRENEAVSSYELKSNGKSMRLHFVVGADDRFMGVSLASMVSKYLRELLVANINSYFINAYEDLKPTAGYWKDGLRFIKEIEGRATQLEFDSKMLVRSR